MVDNTKWENGVKLSWDEAGNVFVSMPVNNIPKKQFDDWMKICKFEFSSKRWDMIMADHIKAMAYDALMMASPNKDDLVDEKPKNDLGLLNGGE